MTDVGVESSELVDGEGFMQPRRVRVTYQCAKCRTTFTRVCKALPKIDPPCPNKSCAEAGEIEALRRQVENLTRMLEEQRPPAQIGANARVKAIDATANIVMEDHKMTDLKDSIREGEIMAPKLPPAAQAAADNYFGGGKAVPAIGSGRPVNTKQANYLKRLGARAIAGDFRSSALSPADVLPTTKLSSTPVSNPGYVKRPN